MGLSANRYILLSFIVSISFIILGGILIPVFKMVTRERMKKVCRNLQTLFFYVDFFLYLFQLDLSRRVYSFLSSVDRDSNSFLRKFNCPQKNKSSRLQLIVIDNVSVLVTHLDLPVIRYLLC